VYSTDSDRLWTLIGEVLSSFPSKVPPLESIAEIRTRKRAIRGTVGLTTYRRASSSPGRGRKKADKGTQIITISNDLFDQLSDEAAKGVIVHELAHAWLNEHVSPRSSKRREEEADRLARVWGYGKYLDSLDAETYPVEVPPRSSARKH
jgi:hypothetical protein